MAAVTVEDLIKPRLPDLAPRKLMFISKGLCERRGVCGVGVGTVPLPLPRPHPAPLPHPLQP